MGNKKAYENCKATRFRSGKEAEKSGRNGGIKSGEVRRENADLRKIAQIVANTTLNEVGINRLKRMGYKATKDTTLGTAMVVGQALSAANGNEKAARFVAELLGITDNPKKTGADDPLTEAVRAELGGEDAVQ